MRARTRVRIGEADVACALCGHVGLVLERTRARRQGLALVNPWWDAHVREYAICPACGARTRRDHGDDTGRARGARPSSP